MPVTPPSIPQGLHNTLSAIRSSIFLTQHNQTNARLGMKYLRKGLAGPSLLSYYPKPIPKPSKLNKSFERHMEKSERKYLREGGDPALLEEWKTRGQVAPGYRPVEKKPEAEHWNGLFWDAREGARAARVARLLRMGKGATKKGEGKRSQMGKKKK